VRSFVLITFLLAFSSVANAIGAGQYYYFISDRCSPKGPQAPEERGAVTPDVMLFEVLPAGISDYVVNMNIGALNNYAEEGQTYLSELEAEQVYTAGQTVENGNRLIHHDFMLQREAMPLDDLVSVLSGFSQLQKDKGYYYKTILALPSPSATFKAVTSVRLTEVDNKNHMFLSHYRSDYFLLDETGNAEDAAFISVDHNAALTSVIHPHRSPYNIYTAKGLCGEKWLP